MSEEPDLGAPAGEPPPPPPPPPGPIGAPPPPGPPAGAPPPTRWSTPAPVPPTQAPGAAGWAGPNPGGVAWAPPPQTNSGCLRACLLVGLLGVALIAVLAIVGAIIGGRVVDQLQSDPDGFFGPPCQLVDSFAIGDAIGEHVDAFETDGFMGNTVDTLLDRRLLADAPDCYLVGQSGFLARIAIDDAGGAAAYAAARAEADGSFLLTDIRDVGDEAFCTTASSQGFAGILVRFDDRVAYVSAASQGFTPDATRSCNVARGVARTLAP